MAVTWVQRVQLTVGLQVEHITYVELRLMMQRGGPQLHAYNVQDATVHTLPLPALTRLFLARYRNQTSASDRVFDVFVTLQSSLG
jgi:hypothetical protein